jgi:drug/metabolite transporter (DMT)-like permease
MLGGVGTIVILSEAALSLYPILIKTIPTDLGTQLVARLVTYSVLGFSFASWSDIRQTWGSLTGLSRSIPFGIMTLAHIFTSYFAFKALPAGISMSLFYSYPIFNLIGAALGFGERFGTFELLLVAAAFLGVILVSLDAKDESDEGSDKREGLENKGLNWLGIAAGLAAALTESGMYFAVRTAKKIGAGGEPPNPFYAVLELYPAALPFLLGALKLSGKSIDTRGSVWGPMILFNAIVGFVGYCLRFYAVPRLSTVVFSLLSFVGVITSFLWGWLFAGEIPTVRSLIGGSLIAAAAAFVKES